MNDRELNFVWEFWQHLSVCIPGDGLVDACVHFALKYDFDIEELPLDIHEAVKIKIKEIYEEKSIDNLEEF